MTSSEPIVFRNRQAQSGIDFRLENSPSAERFLIETMTGGCAFLDFDGDGCLQRNGRWLASGKGLGIAVNDFDGDGWPDIYVANDQVPSFLVHNRQGKSFEEIGSARQPD